MFRTPASAAARPLTRTAPRVAALAAAVGAALLHQSAFAADVVTQRVSFTHEGSEIVGTLYLPAGATSDAAVPAVVVTGSWTSVKEQMPGLYAEEMAERGLAALTFDFRGWGESGGEVRYVEDPAAKTADIAAAAEWLAGQPGIDPMRVGGLGICASAGYMAGAAATGDALSSVALVAPWLHDEGIARAVYGGAEGVEGLIGTSREAEAAQAAGDPMIMTAAGPEGSDALMAMDGYYSDPERGLIPEYDNRFNLASWEPWLTFDGVEIAERLTVPTLVVHSDAAAIPDGARAFVSRLTGPATQMWLENVMQFDFYDDPEDVQRAADAAAEHFEKTLPAS